MAAPLLPVADARRILVSNLAPLDTEIAPLANAFGRVLAETPAARVSHPPADVSAMDGYAVRAGDLATTPTKLKIVGESAAGHPWTGTVQSGEAVRIFTGAYVPKGADTIVIQENTSADGDTVSIKNSAQAGKHIRPKEQDFRAGENILKSPRKLTARDIGLLAAMNVDGVRVFRKPQVGILSTGDELIAPGKNVKDGQIVSANGLGLSAFVESYGGIAVDLGIVPDDIDALRAALARAESLDIILTSGGVSVGKHDLVSQAAPQSDLEVIFHKIAMRPGKPLLFGRWNETPFLGLPGNPVSAMVCALLFVGPALDTLQGLPGDAPRTIPARLSGNIPPNDAREDYIRAVVQQSGDDLPRVSPLSIQDSAMVAALATASALIVRAPHAPEAKDRDILQILPLT